MFELRTDLDSFAALHTGDSTTIRTHDSNPFHRPPRTGDEIQVRSGPFAQSAVVREVNNTGYGHKINVTRKLPWGWED